jgi:hypothetical protein
VEAPDSRIRAASQEHFCGPNQNNISAFELPGKSPSREILTEIDITPTPRSGQAIPFRSAATDRRFSAGKGFKKAATGRRTPKIDFS